MKPELDQIAEQLKVLMTLVNDKQLLNKLTRSFKYLGEAIEIASEIQDGDPLEDDEWKTDDEWDAA